MIIAELKKEHIPPIIVMCNNVFGENYIQPNYLTEYLDLEHKNCLVCINDGIVIGFITYEAFNRNDFLQEILKDNESFVSVINGFEELIIIKQVVVASNYRKQGIASSLLKKVLEDLKHRNHLIFCFAWKKNENTVLKNILKRANFKIKTTIENYWEQDSLVHQYNCSFCGSPPCVCSSEVYIKKCP